MRRLLRAGYTFHNVFHRKWETKSGCKTAQEEPQVRKNRGFARIYFTVTAPISKGAAQMARGPRSNRIGSINMALRSPKTPLTAIPTRRKGSVSNHTMGYNTRASIAMGQHKKNRMIHKKKAAMTTSLFAGNGTVAASRTSPRRPLFYITRLRAERFPPPHTR